MLQFQVSWLPLVVGAVANFFVSWIYYSPIVPWFRAWELGTGRDPDKREMTEEERKKMPVLMGSAALASLVLTYGVQVLVHSLGETSFWGGALVGVVCWLAFAVTHGLNTLFEGRKGSILVINDGLFLITYAGLAGLAAVWR